MRRSVDRLTRDRRALPGRAAARALALATLVAAGADAGDGDGPDLTPPSEMKIISKPSTTTSAPVPPAARPSTSPPRTRAMLALPGLTTAPSRASIPLEGPKPSIDPTPGEVSLDAPIEMKPLAEAPPNNPAARSNLPLILESSPIDDPASPGGSTSRTTSPSRKPTTPPRPAPMPARRPRLFGLLGGQAAATAPSAPPRTSTPGRSVAATADPRDEPASEAALRRRIERQAREVVGNRARTVEVKLEGKEAVVQVSGVKMFQKRAVRKQLEGIPALSGLRSTIEVCD